MIITIHGEDSLRSRKELEKIIKRYRKKYPKVLNFKIFDKDSAGKDLENIKNFFSQNLIFKEPKFVIAQDCLSIFIDSSSWKKIKDEKDDLLVFFESGEGNEKKISLVKKYGEIYRYPLLTDAELRSWAIKEFEERGLKIERLALLKLLELTRNNTWLLSEEINKLACFNPRKEITISDINLLINSATPQNIDRSKIFKAIDYTFSGEKDKALYLIRELLDGGESVLYILSMFSFQLRNMIIVKTSSNSELNQKSKMKPFVIKKSIYQATRFSLDELKASYNNILKTDINIKLGKIDPEIALELFVATIK